MPTKNTKETKTEDVKQSKVKSVKKVEKDSDNEVETKTTKGGKGKKNEPEPEVETKVVKGNKGKKLKKTEESSDEEAETETEGEGETASELEAGSEDDSESEEKEKKPKEKKAKESFEELTKKLETLQGNIKDIEKEIKELEKQTEIKEKMRRDYERQVTSISKILLKTHNDEVTKALKSKPKRKGNVNGGFNKENPVPEVLREFLGLAEGTCMARPKVMSALNNKFSELKLKNGQTTTLDRTTAKALGLGKEGDGKEIKFTEFQSFLASFYPKKEDKEIEA